MPNLLNIASTSLLAFQRAISTVGHNISNVNTEGYSRQDVLLETRTSSRLGSSYVGSGVQIGEFRRITDQFAINQLRTSITAQSYSSTYFNQAKQIDGFLADPNISVADSLQGYFTALHTANNNPNNVSARTALLSQADLLASRFQTVHNELNNQINTMNGQINQVVTEINSLAKGIAQINVKVVGGGTAAPELLDERDRLLNESATLILGSAKKPSICLA